MINNKYTLASIALLSLTLLNACGGGGTTSNTSGTDNTPSQPHQLYANNVQAVDVLSRPPLPAPTVTTDATSITITYYGSDLAPDEHNQFYLNIDNDATTGYQFDGEAWDKAGADYIVEDGHLYKSTANDSSWSWDTNVGGVTHTETGSSVSVTIEKSLLQGLTPTIRVGLMKVDSDWNKVLDFYPHSSLMAEYTIDTPPPVDTIPPVVTLIGAQTIKVKVNSVFTDPGATAKDNIDGDITHKITTSSNLNINKIGIYKIVYKVIDAAGLSAINARTVKVIATTPSGMVVDGKKDDWLNIPELTNSSKGILKATDADGYLYILVDSNTLDENTQIFLDTDNNSATGFQFNGSVWNQGGADYMIENDHLDKSTASNSSWSWDYNVATVEFIKKGNLIEVAIPKSALGNLADTINIGFVNRDADWNVQSVLPESGMVSYAIAQQQAGDLVLLPKFCGSDKLWETRGTPETTKGSPVSGLFANNNLIVEHNGAWYGSWKRVNPSTGETEIEIVSYNGESASRLLALHLVRDKPLGDDKITAMAFLGDTLYFVFGNELWSTGVDGSPSTHLVKKFANVSRIFIHHSENFLVVSALGSDTWIINPPSQLDGSEEILNINLNYKTTVKNKVYLFEYENNNDRFPIYYEADNAGNIEKVNFIPLRNTGSNSDRLFYYIKNGSSFDLWSKNSFTPKFITSFEEAPSQVFNSQYVVTTKRPRSFLWKIDSINGGKTFIRKTQDATRINRGFQNAFLIDGISYFTIRLDVSRTGPLGTSYSSTTLYRETASEISALGIRYRFINNSLYFINIDKNINVIKGGQIKKLASCN